MSRIRVASVHPATAVTLALAFAALLPLACASPGGTVTGGSFVSFSQGSDPAATFSRVTGCESRHFLADYSNDVSMLFNYSATDAHLLMNDEVYDWDGAPDVVNTRLTWTGDFDPAGGNPALSVDINVDCPLPSPS